MKRFQQPRAEVVRFQAADVIATSVSANGSGSTRTMANTEASFGGLKPDSQS